MEEPSFCAPCAPVQERPCPDGEVVIDVEDVSFSYTSNITGERMQAIDGVRMQVARGEFVAILGANGSGKSTLAKLINAQMLPESGAIRVMGMDTAEPEHLWSVRAACGMVFQNPDNQIVATIVEEDVAFGPENLGLPQEEIARRVDEALRTVEMEAYRHHSPSLLSGGQKQRVAIAGILAIRPEILLMDEPTAMLDPGGRKDVMETILRLNRQEKKTIVLITHFMEEAMLADTVYIFQEGKILRKGTPREIFRDPPRVRAAGLDVPFVPEMEYLLGDRAVGFDGFSLEAYARCLLSKCGK